MAADEIECHVCGARNARGTERCQSCGAKLSELAAELSEEELYARRHQPDEFELRWVFIAFGLFLVLAALALALLPLVISTYDPQGFPGIVITIALWFFGAAAINYLTPGQEVPRASGWRLARRHPDHDLPRERRRRVPALRWGLRLGRADGDHDGADGRVRRQLAAWRPTRASRQAKKSSRRPKAA